MPRERPFLLRKSIWKTLWFSLLRSVKDQRARRLVLGFAGFLAWLLFEVWLLVVAPIAGGQGLNQLIFNGVCLAMGIAAAGLIKRSNQRQDELLNFSITGRTSTPVNDEVPNDIAIYLAERAAIIASLLARAQSEFFLTEHSLPSGLQPVTRQVQNSILRQMRLWEKLDQHELTLVAMADGLWNEEQKAEAIGWCEQLRLLRWVLRVDAELVPLAHDPGVDFSLSHAVLEAGNLIVADSPRGAWEIRVELETAYGYLIRIAAEMRERAVIPESGETDAWMHELRKSLVGDSNDLVSGSKTIGDLDEVPLRQLGLMALARFRYAGYLVDQMGASEHLSFRQREISAAE